MHPRDLYSRLFLISQLTPNFNYKTIKIFILSKGNQQQQHKLITMLIHYAFIRGYNAVSKHTITVGLLILLQIEHALHSYTSFVFNAAFHEEVKKKHKLFNKHAKVEDLY